MRIIGDQVTLRDFRKEDIIRRMSWETEQTEWQKWDAPWEYEDLSSEQISKWLQEYQKRLENQAEELLKMDDRVLRRGFEIEYTLSLIHISQQKQNLSELSENMSCKNY